MINKKLTYYSLITEAIESQENKHINVSDIYKYIEKNYKDFKDKKKGWQNSVRHALSYKKIFIKTKEKYKGKGCLWTLDKNYRDMNKRKERTKRETNITEFDNFNSKCYNSMMEQFNY